MVAILPNLHERLGNRYLQVTEELQLSVVGYRLSVFNVRTWMQRTAQDWLVLTQLTHHHASAVGRVMAARTRALVIPLLKPPTPQA